MRTPRTCVLVLLSVLATAACSSAPAAGVDIRRYCVAYVSCQNGMTSTGVAACVQEMTDQVAIGITNDRRRVIDCYIQATTCQMAIDCASQGRGPSYCSGHAGVTCDGDVLVSCANPDVPPAAFDCQSLGLTCRPSGPAQATCTTGRMCVNPSSRCDGNRIVTCAMAGGWEYITDCDREQRGSRCTVVGTGAAAAARCLPDAMACTSSTFAQQCVNNARVICPEATQRQATIPCAMDETCTVADNRAECVPNTTDCTPPERDMCVGNQIQICLRGRRSLIPCNVLGATSCMLNMSQASCR